MAIFNGWNIILDCLSVKNLLLLTQLPQNTPLLKKQFFLDGLHIGALNAYWLLVAVLIEVFIFCPNSTKNRNLAVSCDVPKI